MASGPKTTIKGPYDTTGDKGAGDFCHMWSTRHGIGT